MNTSRLEVLLPMRRVQFVLVNSLAGLGPEHRHNLFQKLAVKGT